MQIFSNPTSSNFLSSSKSAHRPAVRPLPSKLDDTGLFSQLFGPEPLLLDANSVGNNNSKPTSATNRATPTLQQAAGQNRNVIIPAQQLQQAQQQQAQQQAQQQRLAAVAQQQQQQRMLAQTMPGLGAGLVAMGGMAMMPKGLQIDTTYTDTIYTDTNTCHPFPRGVYGTHVFVSGRCCIDLKTLIAPDAVTDATVTDDADFNEISRPVGWCEHG